MGEAYGGREEREEGEGRKERGGRRGEEGEGRKVVGSRVCKLMNFFLAIKIISAV